MKTLLLIVAVAVTLAAVPASAQSAAQQAFDDARARETLQIVEQAVETLRRVELILRVNRATGAMLSADRIEATANGVSAEGNVRLTFSGGAIGAGAVVIQDDGVIRVLGDSELRVTTSR